MGARKSTAKWWIIGAVLVFAWFMGTFVVDNSNDDSAPTPSSSTPAASSSSPTTTTSSTPRVAGRYTIASSRHFGCVSQDDYDDLLMYLVQDDLEAASQALALGVMLGSATIFEEGEVVFVTDTKIWSGLVQVRREGETVKYWTATEAVERGQNY